MANNETCVFGVVRARFGFLDGGGFELTPAMMSLSFSSSDDKTPVSLILANFALLADFCVCFSCSVRCLITF